MTNSEKQSKEKAVEEPVTFHFSKEDDFSTWFTEINKRAELSDLRYGVKGFVVYRYWAVKTLKIMYSLFEEELERHGHWPVIFPALIPTSYLKQEADHVEGFTPQVFWVTRAGTDVTFEEPLALRPTSESSMYPMYSLWIRSWRDLPLKRYQSCQVWRYEGKMTRPFFRGREFHWIEAHNVFATQDEAEAQVLEDLEITKQVITDHCAIPFITFKRPQWDKFAGAVYTAAADTLMPDGRLLQLPSTHMLGDNFAKAFNIKYINEQENERFAFQTCFGPGISRIYGALITVHGDDNGLILPFELAPIQVVIIPIPKKGAKQTVQTRCQEIETTLRKAGFRVQIDDTDKRPGDKYYYWEMRGVPLRLEIGNREVENKTFTVFRRDLRTREVVAMSDLGKSVHKLGEALTKELRNRAEKRFVGAIQDANNLKEVRQILKSGQIARVNFCSMDLDGATCAEKIKDQMGGEVRGTRLGQEEQPWGPCIVCGKSAKAVTYIGRAY
ncbi:MAG: proline--tRNA ligase [Promethearchaeota archaeon]